MLEDGEEEKVEEEEGPEDEEGRGVDPGDEEDRVEGGAEGGVKGNCIKLILLASLNFIKIHKKKKCTTFSLSVTLFIPLFLRKKVNRF